MWLDLLYGWICLFDWIFCLRHVLCVCVGCVVWMDALFGWMLCLIGCFVRRDALFGGEVFLLMVGFVCLAGLFFLFGRWGALYGCGCVAHGVVLFGVMFCFGWDVFFWLV